MTLRTLATLTGYTPRTLRRHVSRLAALALATVSTTARGTVVKAGRSTLYRAAQQVGTAGRTARLAVDARVAQAVHQWWQAEEAWCELTVAEKRAQGRRRDADQAVLPGMLPGHRTYPRTAKKAPDHARARRIEAARIDADGLTAHAAQLAERGELVDPARLSATGAEAEAPQQKPARRPRRAKPRPGGVRPRQRGRGPVQLALPGVDSGQEHQGDEPRTAVLQLSCPRCDARSGQPCTSQAGARLSTPHQGRRTKARRAAERRTHQAPPGRQR